MKLFYMEWQVSDNMTCLHEIDTAVLLVLFGVYPLNFLTHSSFSL